MPEIRPSAFAIVAHPDDIEFCCAGTLLLLREAGWDIHYMNVSSGNCGSLSMDAALTRTTRQLESQRAAEILGATWHPSIADDLEIVYSVPLLRQLAAVVRTVRPRIVLTHSPQDYMIDHENTARLAVTAAFSRGMPNFETNPRSPSYDGEVTVYHAMPHGLCDPLLRQPVQPDGFINTASVHDRKRLALAAHASQKEWLDASQGMDSYLLELDATSAKVGAMSGQFQHAEGWRRRSHLGFSATETDPLVETLGSFWVPSS
ncbi:MAG: PIG-L family deacetylase [Verrucomicrobiales bacterium]